MSLKESRVPSAFMKLDRDSADAVLAVVEKYGRIKASTLSELCHLLDIVNREFHIEVAVHPSKKGGAVMKTIDNENDAQLTIQNIKKRLDEVQS